jgi:hypothetical protein
MLKTPTHIRPDLYNNFIMEIQDKTKDELITELNELLKKTNYLKVQNETLTAELLLLQMKKLFFPKKSASLLIIPNKASFKIKKRNRANELIISNKKLLFKMKKRKALSWK